MTLDHIMTMTIFIRYLSVRADRDEIIFVRGANVRFDAT